jgi:hypothetical protein
MTRTRVGTALATVLLVLAAGCSGDDRPEEPQPSQDPVALRLATVSGAADLDGRARTAAEDGIGDVLSSYVVGGFLGEYPRRDFVRAFDTFSSGLVGLAAPDLEVLTGSRFGDAEAVRAVRLDARISLLADGTDVVGASAAVRFDFEATLADGTTQPFGLHGRLLLEKDEGTWSLFGYDVARDDRNRVQAEAS